jgi:ammonia channel protein AmtB
LIDYNLWFFQYSFAATASTIDSGAVAGRFSFDAYVLLSFFLTGWTYPVVVHWVWANGGILSNLGYIDFAGSSVVHVVGGASGLVAAWWVGPRHGRFLPVSTEEKESGVAQAKKKQVKAAYSVQPVDCDEDTELRSAEDRRKQQNSNSSSRSKGGNSNDKDRGLSPSFSNSPVSLLYGTFILWIGWYVC